MMSIPAKKSLGQHFLNAPVYLRMIADAAKLHRKDTTVEIGPGKGSLTAELLSRGVRVIAIEKDHRLLPALAARFPAEIARGELTLVEEDALAFDPLDYDLEAGAYTLVGNIPYYITGVLFEKFLGRAPHPRTLVFLVQKEVAERIAKDRKESILSLSVKAYGTPKYIKTVPRGAFTPAPGVDSAILAIYDISNKHFKNDGHEKWFFELVRAGFAHKRKFLARNLEPLLGKDYSLVLQNIGISPSARAEDVPLTKWLALAGRQ